MMHVVGDEYVIADGRKLPIEDVLGYSQYWHWTGPRIVPRALRPFFAGRYIRTHVRIACRQADSVVWIDLATDEPLFSSPVVAALASRGVPQCAVPFSAGDGEDYPAWGNTLSAEDRATLRGLPNGTGVIDSRRPTFNSGDLVTEGADIEHEPRVDLVDPGLYRHVGEAGPFRLYRKLRPL